MLLFQNVTTGNFGHNPTHKTQSRNKITKHTHTHSYTYTRVNIWPQHHSCWMCDILLEMFLIHNQLGLDWTGLSSSMHTHMHTHTDRQTNTPTHPIIYLFMYEFIYLSSWDPTHRLIPLSRSAKLWAVCCLLCMPSPSPCAPVFLPFLFCLH